MLRTQACTVLRPECSRGIRPRQKPKMSGKKEDKNVKRFSRLVAVMVALALMLTGVVFAESQGTIAERYQDALSRLERYLMNLQDDSVNITTLAEDFQKLGNYEGSNAFYYYTLGLADASVNNYTLIPMYIDALVINTSFDARLTNLRANGVNIPSVAEWAAYLNGRVAESEGNYAEAAAQYQQCLNFMDAQNRILYALAWSRQTSVAATPAPTAVPTTATNTANTTVTVYPPTLYANVSGKSISLEWTSVSGATNYSLYRRRTNYDKNFQLIYSGSALSYKDTSANANYNYTYYVAATTSEGRQLSSNEKTAIISSNSGSNNQSPTTTKPPVTNPPVTNPPVTTPPVTNPHVTTPPITPVPVTSAPVTAPPTTPPPQWSAWTQWSTTPVSSSSTRQVETKVETETYSIPVYNYSRWYYYNTGWGKWTHSYTQYTGSNYKSGSGNWQYKSSYEPLAKVTPIDGHQQYNGGWWNESVSYEQGTYEVTYYRYRDLQ